ncbi:MAG: hypothetical protein IJF87_03695 [Erysipelotrichaceae bacterium]|nr:hypothetical protein [Erysipelotrichaceae bacterium]
MYCRKCGAKFDNHLIKCPKCGTEVLEVKQISYDQKYREEKQKEKENREQQRKLEYPKDAGIKENPNLNFAIVMSFGTFLFSMIPWPKSWGIGSTLWMKILVLVLSLMAIYHCLRATQISNFNKKQAEAYNKKHPKAKIYYEKPVALTIASVFATATFLLASLSLFL